MALADALLLAQQARVDERLADGVGERAVVAGEAARQMVEGGVVAAPLAHSVEALQRPPRHLAHRDPGPRAGRWCRVRTARAGASSGRLERLDRVLVERVAAEPRDRLGDAQRVRRRRSAGAGPATPASTWSGTRRVRARSRSMPVEGLVERLLGVLGGADRVLGRVDERQRAVEVAEQQRQVDAGARRSARPWPRPPSRPPRRRRRPPRDVTASVSARSSTGSGSATISRPSAAARPRPRSGSDSRCGARAARAARAPARRRAGRAGAPSAPAAPAAPPASASARSSSSLASTRGSVRMPLDLWTRSRPARTLCKDLFALSTTEHLRATGPRRR